MSDELVSTAKVKRVPETLTAAEARKLMGRKKRSKYGNRKTVFDGVTFDSAAEASFYKQLKIREGLGEIGGLELQRRYALLGPNGEAICTYIPDFCFWDHNQGRFRVVDVKGMETDVFKLKRKMMRALLGIEVEVIKHAAR